ncbi:MAG: MATE family efflux transporter [Cellulosilyticaceae bacterium]
MEKKGVKLGTESIGKLMFTLALPAIIAQLVNVLYNIIDRICIGRLDNGELAIAGVGVAFPIIIIVSAFSALFGMGGAPLAAIKMGENNKDGAEKIMNSSFAALVSIGIIVTIILLIFSEKILWQFGASEETIGYALEYLNIYTFGTIAVMIVLGMNAYINTQGFAKVGMTTVLVGAIINIILDPILIFGFDMGVRGAAIATIIAQFVSAIWVLYFLFGKEKVFKRKLLTNLIGIKSTLKIRKNYLKPEPKILLAIMALGISPFIMQATESLVLISVNRQLAYYGNGMEAGLGDLAIGAMTIIASVMQIILLPLQGLAQGAQPIISYNYGAGQVGRVKKTYKMLLSICLCFTTIMWVLVMCIPEMFVNIFNNNPEIIEITTWAMKIYFLGIIMMGIQNACQQTFLAMGQAKISLFLALLRKIILLIPLMYILPLFLENKLGAVFMAEPVADILAALTTLTCFIIFYKKVFVENKDKSGNI